MNKLIQYVVMAAVGVLIFSALLIPIINDASKTNETITNTGAFYMVDDDTSYTMTYDPTGTITVNGDVFDFRDFPRVSTLVSTDTIQIRFNNYTTSSAIGSYALLMVTANNYSTIANSGANDPVTITFDNGVFTKGTTTTGYDSDTFRGLSTSGKYVMTATGTPAKVQKSTDVILADGDTQVNAWYNRFYIEGTVDTMAVIATPTGITTSDLMVNTAPVSNYRDVVELNSITFTATDGENTIDATYDRVIVPAEITAELAVHADDSTRAIIGVIPLIVIVGLIAGIIGVIAVRRGA